MDCKVFQKASWFCCARVQTVLYLTKCKFIFFIQLKDNERGIKSLSDILAQVEEENGSTPKVDGENIADLLKKDDDAKDKNNKKHQSKKERKKKTKSAPTSAKKVENDENKIPGKKNCYVLKTF